MTRASLDIADLASVRQVIGELLTGRSSLSKGTLDPAETVLINTAAYNLVDQAESEPDVAMQVNALGPKNLAIVTNELGLRLVHFSTDYVFGGDIGRQTPLTELDPVAPISTYGFSKASGETLIRNNAANHLILRTCGLFGVKGSRGKGGNFVETMIRLAQTGKQVRVVNDQFCTPTHTAEVARLTRGLLATAATGTFHVTSTGTATWYEVAKETFRLLNLDVDCSPITTREFPTPARRPPYSVLSVDKLEQATGLKAKHWREGLAAYLTLKYPDGLPTTSKK